MLKDNMEPENQPRLIFGLSPKSTIINAIILACVAQLFWTLKFLEQIPPGFDFENPPADFQAVDNVPWYYDMPIAILAMIMAMSWIQFKFKISREDYSWRAIKYKYVYLILGLWGVQAIAKLIFIFLILSFK